MVLCFYFRFNSRKKYGFRNRLALSKTVSRRKFDFSTEERIKELQQIQLKKSVEAKCKWALTAYNDWRNERLKSYNYDYPIYAADINDLEHLEKENLLYALCRFVPEVTKTRGDGPYPGATLYQLISALQKYLWVNKINWELIEGSEFSDLKTVLDNVMQERT